MTQVLQVLIAALPGAWLVLWFGPGFLVVRTPLPNAHQRRMEQQAHPGDLDQRTRPDHAAELQPRQRLRDVLLRSQCDGILSPRPLEPVRLPGRAFSPRSPTTPPSRPIELMREIIKTFSFDNSQILVPFAGSGAYSSRRCYGKPSRFRVRPELRLPRVLHLGGFQTVLTANCVHFLNTSSA